MVQDREAQRGLTALSASANSIISVPSVPPPLLGGCHAVKTQRLTWTSAIDGSNLRADTDDVHPVAEMNQALANLAAVLSASGHDWDDVVRVNAYYDVGRVDPSHVVKCHEVLAATIGASRCAGSGIMLAPIQGGRLALEAVAADHRTKAVLPALVDLPSGPWAAATRVGSIVFISGVVADDFARTEPSDTAPGFFAHSHAAYRQLARAADAVRDAWPDCNGLDDVVRLHQHVTRRDIDLGDFRRSRADLLRAGDFVSTTVRAERGDPDDAKGDPWIKIDAELVIGRRRRVSVPGVWANPGGLHAVLSDDFAFFQAQMGRDGAGLSVHADDPDGHAEQVYANIDRMLSGAGLEWSNVVHIRVFCRDHEQVAAASRRMREHAGGHSCAVTCVIAGFFDSRAMLEIEVTAAL
jgi:enamine deaminase RidA (YjgF/YER057c/UK114 family)